MPINLLYMFLLTYTLGPATAVPYAIQFWSKELTFAFLFTCYTAPLPLLFIFLSKVDYVKKAENKILSLFSSIGEREFRKAKKAPEQLLKVFQKKWGYLGHNVATVFMAFSMGFLWAAVFAYSFKLPRNQAYKSIAVGNVLGLLFWIFLMEKASTVVNPNFFVFFFLILAGLSWLYGEISERRLAKQIAKQKVSKRVNT
ncbi:hypothetical protein DRN74_01520 [Candidatus Micrarchaeota archaeon]|nr:MAG: hypothetical protein DRN74_01520 [Candidatus Micrarchaeota archaeon]